MNNKLYRSLLLLFTVVLALVTLQPTHAAPGDTIRVSLDANGAQIGGTYYENSISGDGRYIAFVTPFALVTADTNGQDDIYVRDTQTNTTLLVSVATDGTLGNNVSAHPAISANGQFVVFQSNATTLTSHGIGGIFMRDLVNNTTTIVSVNNSGTPTPNPSFHPSISANGRYVAFSSWARQNLTANCGSISDNNEFVYLRDTVANTTTCAFGGGSAVISGDGRYVTFGSGIQLWVWDTQTNTSALVSVDSAGNPGNAESTDPASVSYDGRFVAFNSAANNLVANDTNGWKDTFVHDRDTDTDGIFDEPGAISTYRVSVATDGSQATAYSLYPPSISGDGRFVAFTSRAKNLVPGIAYDTEEVYLRDTLLNATSRISVSSSGVQASGSSEYPSLSADGHFVSFSSAASDLVSGDTNGNTDIFRHDISPANGAPVDINLSNNSVAENQAVAVMVGTFSTIDPSPGDTFTYSFCGGTDDASFSISGNSLKTATMFDYETKNSYSICVRTTDSASLTFDKNFTVNITDIVNENIPLVLSMGPLSQTDGFFYAYVSFERPMVNVDPADFTLTATGELTNAFIADVSDSNIANPTGLSYIIAVNLGTLTGSGTIHLSIPNTATITDTDGNNLSMLPYPGFGYGITQYPKVKSINRNSPNPAGNGNVAYIVTFTESVSGVDASDFALSASGVTGAQIVNVTGSGQTRSVTVSTGNGDGTLRLDLVDDDSIMDVNGSKLGGDGLGNGNFAGQTYTIDNNQAPTNITLSNASVAENQGFSATVGTLSSVDPDAGNTFTYAFCGGTDDSLFSINFSTLKTNAIFDFETKNSYAICIRSTDNLGLGFDKNFTIAITNINEQPTITSDGGGLSASVNATENSTTVTTASASDPDAGAVLTYSISGGADAAKFSINPATGTLTFITAPNFEAPTDSGANNVYDVTVQVSDGTLTDSQSIAVTVHNANEAPTNLSLSNSSVTENQPNDTLVGTLSASDQDTGATFTYSMTCATPGVDNAYFRLDGNNLLTNATFNYEAKSSYSICLRVTDNSALSFDKNFTITVIDIPGLELMWPSNNFHLTSNRPTFVWNVYPGAIGYQIQVGRDAGFTNLIVNATLSGGTTNSYTPTTDLPINTQLYWRVRPRISSLQFGAWSSAFTFFTANPPSTPTLLTPLSGALLPSAVVTLDWADSTTPAGTTFGFYMLEIATDSAFTNMALRLPLYGIANSQFTWSNAVRGKTYYWHVLATTVENSAVTAYSAWSATRSFSIKYAVPTLLTPAHFSAVTTLRPTFTWNGPAGVTFTIQISRSNTFGLGTLSANANTNSYTPGVNLYSRTTYYWRVKVNGTYASDWSTVFSFTTP